MNNFKEITLKAALNRIPDHEHIITEIEEELENKIDDWATELTTQEPTWISLSYDDKEEAYSIIKVIKIFFTINHIAILNIDVDESSVTVDYDLFNVDSLH